MITSRRIFIVSMLLFVPCVFNGFALGQILLNEISIDSVSPAAELCQYIEVRGTPGSIVPANTTFLSIDGESGSFGQINFVGEIGGRTIGSNGTLVITNRMVAGNCPNRTYPVGTTLVDSFSSGLGFGSETYLLVQTASPGVFNEGDDLDLNDDGQIDASYSATPIDGFGFAQNPLFSRIYGGAPIIYDAISGANGLDLPDAATRFRANTSVFDGNAWYFGELAAPQESTAYQAPLSPNFPNGGALTPGAPNLPAPRKAVVDLNGDGRTDFSVTRIQSGLLNWYSSINGSSQTAFLQWGQQADIPVPEDFDGDGKDDLAVWRAGNPLSAGFYILRSSDNTFRFEVFGQTGDNPRVVGDWDGDGKADPAVYRPNAEGSQSYFYYRGSLGNPTGSISYVPWGLANDIPVRGDFDGDGKYDAAVFRTVTLTWYILQSSNSSVRYDSFGAGSDKFVAADYDGDLKTDLAVFRDGVWYVKQSTNGTVIIQTWGLATDVPVPGDYTGDGKSDFAVWRNGVFYVQPSAGGGVVFQAWGLTGDIPAASTYTQ